MTSPYHGIDHVGIAVSDLNDAIAIWRDILGFPVSGTERLEERGLHVAFVETGSARLELIAPTRADSEVSSFLNKRGAGVHHVCLRVPDIHAAVDRLQQNGATLASGGVRPGAHGTQVAFVHPRSAGGVLVELVQLPTSEPAPLPK